MNLIRAFLISLLLLPVASYAQTDLSKATGSADRKAILDVLRAKLRPELGQDVTFVVEWLKVKNGFAYFRGSVRTAAGGGIDFAKIPAYREAVAEGLFDGPATFALLKKSGNSWKYVTHLIGPTDVGWGCWWKEHKAPREIFDVAEERCEY